MSSIVFPDYEEINDELTIGGWGARSKGDLPWSVLNKDQAEGKVKIPSTLITAFIQYTTEELDQLDQPQCSHRRGQEGEQYPTVPPLVYRITSTRVSCWYRPRIWKKRFSIFRSNCNESRRQTR